MFFSILIAFDLRESINLTNHTDKISRSQPDNLSEETANLYSDLQASRSNCVDAFNSLRASLFTTAELMAEIEKAELEAKVAAEQAAQAAKTAEEVAEALAAAEAIEMLAAQSSPEMEQSGDEHRSRSESVANASRTRSMSTVTKTRPRNSSIFVRLPDNTGTSLIRKSTDIFPGSHTHAAGLHVGSDGTDLGSISLGDDSVVGISNQAHNSSHLDVYGGGAASSSFYGDETNLDISMDLNVSRFVGPNDSMIPEEDEYEPPVALFEHFMVVGASEEVSVCVCVDTRR